MALPRGHRVSRPPPLATLHGQPSPVKSPHQTEDLAADAFLAGLPVAHHALGRTEDRDAQAVEDLGQVLGPFVVPAAGAARPVDGPDDLLAFRAVLQVHPEDGLGLTRLGPLLELAPPELADVVVED